MRPVFLLTDFGLRDPYVGIMRAVIAGISPTSPIHDLGHDLPAQDLRAAAYALVGAAPVLPDGAVVCAVVDPGVGSARLPIAVEVRLDGSTIHVVAPDNGLIAPLLAGATVTAAVALDETRYQRTPPSATFHGRDIFAPAAAHLAAGVPIERFGRPLDPDALTALPWPAPRGDGDAVVGEVLAVDRFGNLITNLEPARLDPTPAWRVTTGPLELALGRTYAEVEPGAPVAYVGSTGRVEIGVRNGSASQRFGLGVGTPVRLDPERS